jgi:RND family efflux transporter MFP subunit
MLIIKQIVNKGKKMYFGFRSVVLIIVCSALLIGCEQEKTTEEPRLRSVKYQEIKTNNLGASRTFSGLAKSSQEANLSFKIVGTIQSLPMKVGQQLKAGQLIAQLDSSQYELQIQQSQAALAQAKAGLRNAKASFERLKGLYENNNASRNDLDAARASAESNQAQVRAANKGLELARLNLSYTQLKSNKDCRVAEVNVKNNENVGSGQSIVKVNCGQQMDVEVAVPGLYVTSIMQDMPVEVTFSTLPGKKLAATVSEVGVASSGGGATFPVTVSLKNNPQGLRSGMVAEVLFNFSHKASAGDIIVVPAIAVSEDMQGRYVYIVNPGDTKNVGIIKRINVSVGELTANGLTITEGLTATDKVVTAGVTVIRDGLKVRMD